MKFLKILIGAIASIVLFVGCHDEKKEEQLSKKILELENELENCKYGEEKLTGLIINSFESKDYNKVIETFNSFSNKFPGSARLNSMKELNDAAQKKISEEKELKKASVKKLKLDYDDVRGISWYKQKYFKHYSNTNRASIYIGKEKDSMPFLRLQLSYTGDDWIFFENAYLSHDGDTKQIFFDEYQEKDSDNGNGAVWEWIDVKIDDSQVSWFRKFAESKNAKMRLSGKYTKDRNLTPQERQGILDVLNGYEYLKENP